MRIYLDMDGVIVNLVEPWLSRYNKDFDDNVTREEITTFNLGNHVKIGDAIRNYLREPGFFGPNLKPYENAIEIIQQLDEEHEVYIVTAPHIAAETCERDKREWLREHLPFIPQENVIFCCKKHLLAKPGEIILEDKSETLKAWKANKGISVVMKRPWNRETDGSHCVSNWHEFYYYIKGLQQ